MKVPFGPYCIALDDLKPDPVSWCQQAQPRFLTAMTPIDTGKLKQILSVSHPVVMGRYYNPKYGLIRPQQDIHLHRVVMKGLLLDPIQSARDLFNDMRADVEANRGLVTFWMGLNEPVITNVPEATALNAHTVEWARLMHSIGIECAAYSFSEGNPDFLLWPYLISGIRACNNKVVIHEYAAPDYWGAFPWHIGRFLTKVLPTLPIDLQQSIEVYYGEYGYDGGVINQPMQGWKKKYSTFQSYADSVLNPFVELNRSYHQVKGGSTFAAHWSSADSFDVGNEPGYLLHIKNLPEMTSLMLTDIQRAQLVVNQDFPRPDVALAVSFAENGNGDPLAIYTNTDGSRDRGLWQINDKQHSEVLDEVAFDPVHSTQSAYVISDNGTNFNPWTTYKGGQYRVQLPRAQEALRHVSDPALNDGKAAIANYPPIKLPMPINDQAWLDKFSMQNGLGCAETPEIVFSSGGKDRIIQERARAYAIMVKGDNNSARAVWK